MHVFSLYKLASNQPCRVRVFRHEQLIRTSAIPETMYVLQELCPRLRGLAWLGFSANVCITCYYMIVISWYVACFVSAVFGLLSLFKNFMGDVLTPMFFQSWFLQKNGTNLRL
jgi:SNF family Na+-dependent transporter